MGTEEVEVPAACRCSLRSPRKGVGMDPAHCEVHGDPTPPTALAADDVEQATYVVASMLPACTQCGGYFSGSRACGLAHAIIAADPLRHRVFEALLTKHDRTVAAKALRGAVDEMRWHGVNAPDEGYVDTYEPSHAEWLVNRAAQTERGE